MRLIVNGKEIEGLEVVALTKAANNIGELPTRQGGFSNTLDIPKTKNNLEALGMIENINSLSRVAERFTTYELFDKDNALISVGYIKILAIKDTIQMALLSDNSDWAKLISDRSLRDIDVSALDYVLNAANIAARRLKTDEYLHPNVWYGDFKDPARPWDVLDFQPAFYVRYLLDRIFNDVGYTLLIDVPADIDNLLSRMVLLQTLNEWQQRLDGVAFECDILAQNNTLGPSYLTGNNVKKAINGLNISGFEIGPKQWLTSSPPIAPTSWQIYVQNIPQSIINNSVLKVNFTIRILGFSVVGSDPQISVRAFDFPPMVLQSLPVTGDGIYEFDFEVSMASLPPSQILLLDFTIVDFLYSQIDSLGGSIKIIDPTAQSAFQVYDPLQTYLTNLQGALPDVKQSDLLLTLFNQFGFITSTNNVERTVIIQRVDDLLTTPAMDWSSKIDLTEPPEIIYDFWDNYFQRNVFQYAPDETDTRLTGLNIGVGEIAFDNANQPPVGTLFESAFSPTARGEELSPPMAACEWRLFNNDLNPKIAVVDITNNNLITQFGQSAPTQSAEVFFDEISFGRLITQNYNAVKRMLASNRAVKVLLRLTRTDFDSIDFTVPIYLNVNTTTHGQLVGNFYINEIDQWQPNESCYVTLIKLD